MINNTFIDKKIDVFTIVVDGNAREYTTSRGGAINAARQFLLKANSAAVYDKAGQMVYRHAKPYDRQTI